MLQDGLIYQDSHMSSTEDFIKGLQPFTPGDGGNHSSGGPVLFADGKRLYTDSSESHTLISGDTGSGKTLRYILPMIYSCADAGESMVIIDPKGELVTKATPFLREKGYRPVVINLRSPQNSPDSFNPFGKINKLYFSGDKDSAILMLNDLIDKLFISRSAADKDKYWNESAGQFALGICKLILRLGEKLTIGELLDWRYGKYPEGKLKDLFQTLPASSDAYQDLAGIMTLTAENTKSCILSTFDQLIRLFKAAPSLTNMLSESTFDIDDIGLKRTAIFLVVPDEKTTFHFLATLFISQCYESLVEMADLLGGRLPKRVNFILEEFCNMPMLPDMVSMLTAARSRNIRFHLVIQSYEQLVDKYGEHVSKTILDNCATLIYLHSRELSFLQYISQLAGNNEFNRPLLPVSRLQRIQKNENIIFRDRCYPCLVKDIPMIFDYQVELGSVMPRSA
ncbi:MAG: type IV secretory system conjugative DNA transfer family protein [Oscillospiraceae bacterium]|nr:type IV secretory system conjugative DNA transfer family protein [Oscillospiraceae bacterium]